ncbi:uncharacterized protein ARMOST_16325 [Armillaria ostoyae]|uniref:Uncharacterized protein n=1 Tax=Armillaria ostoyae TaxID=47428 RepID=A0A284RVV3_ARMOS|nr:uncharacterized protein ARMOST_16325 [Armillaria ostoyae]
MSGIPTLDELGLPEATASIHRGENEALRRLEIAFPGKSDKSELSNSARSWRSSPTNIFIPPISLPQIFKRKKAGGAVEYEYPAPILDPELEKKRCMIRIKAAYAQGFHGTTHEIPDGSADDILRGSYKEALGQVDYADSRRRFHVEAETGRRWR